MEEKKLKFELSRLALVFVILFALCILVWTFILGVWIGTKIGGKPQAEEIALEKGNASQVSSLNLPANESNATSQNAIPSEGNETLNATPSAVKETEISKPIEEEKKEPEAKPKELVKKEVVKKEVKRAEKEKPTYQKKEVAHLAAKVKEEKVTTTGFYTLQVGAFSHRDKAEELKKKAEKLGYYAQIKETTKDGKDLYKVYVGKYENRAQAEQSIAEIKTKLGIDKPFIVELK
ncbi:MAG: SPOR domain-containing protein [Caldimicrobium sp.]